MQISLVMQQRFSPRINSISYDTGQCSCDDQKKLLEASKGQGHRVKPKAS